MATNADNEGFQKSADRYAAYLETPEGRLRLDLAFANLQEFLPQAMRSLRALDVGCGTGAIAVRLARLGLHISLLDSSQQMLDCAERTTREAGVSETIVELKRSDAAHLEEIFQAGSFDVVLCHNVLEYVGDPAKVLLGAARMLRNSSAILSVLVRNRAGEVLKAAIQAGDLSLADSSLTAEWGYESLYGGRVRLFTSHRLHAMMKAASLTVSTERGVRTVADYLPQRISRRDEYERIFELEHKLGSQTEFAAVARYTQCIAHRADPPMENAA